jgi:peptidoglycan DL-endopeptidase CwlO
VERLPHGRHQRQDPQAAGSRPSGRRRPAWARGVIVAGAIAVASVVIPAGVAGAAPAARDTAPKTLKATLAEVTKISNQIDSLSQEYDALRIQRTQARREAAIALETVQRDNKLLASSQAEIGQIAAQGYMNVNINPTLQLLQTSNPQEYLNEASIMLQLQQENGDKVDVVSAAQSAARRARLAAEQEETQATRLTAQMQKKVAVMEAKQRTLNSSAFAQAMAIFQRTGNYPDINPTGDSVGVQALRYALTRRGDWYVWGAAGPTTFDCSGLVVWAYAQLGISLPHYTGDIWNLGVHVARDQLQAGDLVFFFPGEEHMGIYVGDGLFLDAPSTGQKVQVQPMLWDVYDGAVRIA